MKTVLQRSSPASVALPVGAQHAAPGTSACHVSHAKALIKAPTCLVVPVRVN